MTPQGDPVFHTTRWTDVLQARQESGTALEELCQRYWYPVYAFIRRRGQSTCEAEDLTQEFFARLLAKRWLDAAEKDRGKFRTFLMMAVKRFLANEWDRSRRLKRGGDAPTLSLDMVDAERRFVAEVDNSGDEYLLYDRGWALTLLAQTLRRLEAEIGRERFEILRSSLTASRGEFDLSRAGLALGLSEGAIRVAVHRFRKRYRDVMRDEVAQTLSDPTDIEGEVRHLIDILAQG